MNIVHLVLVGLASIVSLVVIRFKLKRKDVFLTIVPCMIALSVTLQAPYVIKSVFDCDKDDGCISSRSRGLIVLLLFAGDIARSIGDFIFGLQYLRTSLVLPRLFAVAKIEWLETSTKGRNSIGMQVTKLSKELENHDIEENGIAKQEGLGIYDSCDRVMKE